MKIDPKLLNTTPDILSIIIKFAYSLNREYGPEDFKIIVEVPEKVFTTIQHRDVYKDEITRHVGTSIITIIRKKEK